LATSSLFCQRLFYYKVKRQRSPAGKGAGFFAVIAFVSFVFGLLSAGFGLEGEAFALG
jgi:hypothetical protein